MVRIAIALIGGLALAGCGPRTEARPGPASPPKPTATFDFREMEVRIPARALELEGTLTLPRAAGPRPAVILLQGSGPLGRDEVLPGQLGMMFGFEVAVFRELGHHLARAGFAVIRYDKRTCTRASGCANSYPEDGDVAFDDVLEDAQAVIDWLRRRPEVDPGALYIVGHSLGGAFVPELMTDNPDLRAGVVLAAPYRPIDETSLYQWEHAERLLLHQNKHPLVVATRVRELKEIADGVVSLRRGTLTRRDIAGTSVEFWQAWMDLGDALPAILERVDRPILALSGDADANVPPSETALWKQKLDAASPNPGHQIAILPCVTHALNCLARDERGRFNAASRRVSPAVVDYVVRFLVKHLPPTHAAELANRPTSTTPNIEARR